MQRSVVCVEGDCKEQSRENGVRSVYGHQEGVSVGVEGWAVVEGMEDGSEREDVEGLEEDE